MAWVWLFGAGLLEVGFAISLKLSVGFTKPVFVASFIIIAALSFYCLTKAMHTIPVGTAYAVWTGIGTAGVAVVGMFLFDEAATVLRLLFLTMLLIAIIGLKVVTPEV